MSSRQQQALALLKTQLQTHPLPDPESSVSATIGQQPFGALPDGRPASLFTLSNPFGITVKITNYGGRIVSMHTPDRNGESAEIGIGFDSLDKYLQTNGNHGALIGRVANRIRDGRFSLNGVEYPLWTNANGIHLHGGQTGFARRLWNATVEDNSLRLDYLSPDGEEHYPGTVNATVRYSLEGADLRLEYEATTDRPTIINLTNHAFFNLSAFREKIDRHEFRIQAKHYTPVDEKLLLTGEISPVGGTPFDFTKLELFGDRSGAGDFFIDHNYILDPVQPPLREWLAEARCEATGRTLAMATTEPCMQFYTGNTINVSVPGLSGTPYSPYDAFCFEAQRHPDAPNHPAFPSIVLNPGETYRQTTVYRFGIAP